MTGKHLTARRVIGAIRGKHWSVGALVVYTSDDGFDRGFVTHNPLNEIHICHGFSDAQRKEFWAAYLQDRRNIWNGGPDDMPTNYEFRPWQVLTRKVEIEHDGELPDGQLLRPRFVRILDASAAE